MLFPFLSSVVWECLYDSCNAINTKTWLKSDKDGLYYSEFSLDHNSLPTTYPIYFAVKKCK